MRRSAVVRPIHTVEAALAGLNGAGQTRSAVLSVLTIKRHSPISFQSVPKDVRKRGMLDGFPDEELKSGGSRTA